MSFSEKIATGTIPFLELQRAEIGKIYYTIFGKRVRVIDQSSVCVLDTGYTISVDPYYKLFENKPPPIISKIDDNGFVIEAHLEEEDESIS